MTKEIIIREIVGIGRLHEYVRVALPWGRGEMASDAPLGVLDHEGRQHPCQAAVLKQWPDGSVKWLLADFAATVPARGTVSYRLAPGAEVASAHVPGVSVTPGADSWRVDTGAGQFTLDARTFRPFLDVRRRDEEHPCSVKGGCRFVGDGDSSADFAVEEVRIEENGPLHAVIRCSGRLAGAPDDGPRFSARLHFFAGSMKIKVEFTLHNPRAARHTGGLWDLGDDGSILFRELAFTFPFATGTAGEVRCWPSADAVPVHAAGNRVFRLYQESSGGENWRSPVHRNREGRVPLKRRGYVGETDGSEVCSGLRATPQVWCGANGVGVAAVLPRFWQEFPKALEADGNYLTISLFPAGLSDLHELQGGERKTHAFYLDFAAGVDDLSWATNPLQAVVAPRDYRASGIFTDLPEEADLLDEFSTADDLLRKRETADEYGWRNFGDVHADHEAVFHEGNEPFVTHYNNQYDFCAGIYRKYFATGDPAWGSLASDLARHVLDIDIYHTDLDREEYNRGVFWHTDHYVDAGLSTHRSYSREQVRGKDPRFSGGGPGPEHCYTTGLLLHYFQTGNPDFRQAVIDLTDWVLRALEGPQTVLAALKRGAGYLGLWRSSRGERRLFPRYPLTRGTGNAIACCIDAFEAGGGRRFLDAAEKLIRGTLHPADDIAARNLLNAEIAWSYTVLLVSVVKFLDKKCELGEFDGGFGYARESLLVYAEWMRVNEYPYLDRPEILEYPNETWAAQDLRKGVILYHAARFAPPDRQADLLKRGRFFYEAGRDRLLSLPTSRLTRPVALMLQNGWVGGRLNAEGTQIPFECCTETVISGQPTPYLAFGTVAMRVLSDLFRTVKETSPRREAEWLRTRMS